MGQVSGQTDLSNVTDPSEFMRFAATLVNQIVAVVNGKVEFDKNIMSQTKNVSFATANTDVAVPHNLNSTDVDFLVINKSVSCDVFLGTTAATSNTIYLQCTQATKVKLILL